MSEEQKQKKSASHNQISAIERGIALALAVAVLVTLIVLVLYPRAMNGVTSAIVRLLASIFAGIAGYFFTGNLSLETKIPLSKSQIKASGAFAAFVLVLLLFFVGLPASSDSSNTNNVNLSENEDGSSLVKPTTNTQRSQENITPITWNYYQGINGYPTLMLSQLKSGSDDKSILSVLLKTLNIDKFPIIHSNNPVFESIERFKRETGNEQFINGQDSSGRLTYYSDIMPQSSENADESFRRTEATYSGEENIMFGRFHYAPFNMLFQTSSSDAEYTAVYKTDYQSEIVQFPSLSDADDFLFSSDKKGNTKSKWINEVIKENPDNRGFLLFSYPFSSDFIGLVNMLRFYICQGFDTLVARVMPTPYLRLIDIKNTSSRTVSIKSAMFEVVDKAPHKLTPLFDRSTIFKESNKEKIVFNLQLEPSQHFFIPIEFGFDTKNQKRLIEEVLSTGTAEERSSAFASKEVYIPKPIHSAFEKLVSIDPSSLEEVVSDSKASQGIVQTHRFSSKFISEMSSFDQNVGKIPQKFAIGSILNVTSLEVDGKEIVIEPPSNEPIFSINSFIAGGGAECIQETGN
jgi:hypothetical protein